MPNHVRRRHDLVADPVVGEVEQSAQVVLVAGDAFPQQRLAVGGGRRLLQHEAALAADRHDDGVLHHLRLDEAQHLGAEILRPIGPAQAAARHLAATQVHALEARRVHEDLEHRTRLGQPGDLRRIELEGQERPPRPVLAAGADAGPPEIRARRREDQREVLPQHPVFAQAADLLQRLLDRAHLARRRDSLRRLRVEPELEQLHQQPRDPRMLRERGLDEGLRQCETALAHVLRIRPQHRDLVGRQRSEQHQSIEVVVLHRARHHAPERVLEQRRDALRVDLVVPDQVELEVVDPERVAPLRTDLVRLLRQHAHAHVLEHRQRVRQRDRFARAIHLEAEATGRHLERPIEVEREATEPQAVESLHVGDRRARRHVLAVRRRERVAEALAQLRRPRLALLVVQRLAQVVFPAPGRVRQSPLDIAPVVGGNPSRIRPHGHVDARQRRIGEQHVEVRGAAVERLQQDRLELATQFGGVVLARHVDQARDEPLERVAPDEQAEALALAELQDAVRDLVQLVGRDLEQLVARISLEDVLQRLAEVTGGRESRTFQHLALLAAQQRNLGHARAVRRRREEPEEAVFADRLPVRPVALHADVVDVAGPVHGRPVVGLRHHQHRRRRPCQLAGLRRQRDEARRLGEAAIGVAQHPEACPRHDFQREFAIVVGKVVLPVAEQQQVVLGQPLQEVAVLGHLLARQRRRLAVDVSDRRAQLRDHRLPVRHGRAHVAEHALDALGQLGTRHRIGQAIDFDVHERLARSVRPRFARVEPLQRSARIALDREDRMHDQVQRQALAVDLHRGRVDQEGHVVVDDLDDRVPGRPTMLARDRVDHADLRLARFAPLRELPVRQQGAVQILDVARRDVFRIDAVEVARRERQQARLLGMLDALLDQCRHRGQAHGLVRFRGNRHVCLRFFSRAGRLVSAGKLERQVCPRRGTPTRRRRQQVDR